MTIPLWRRLTIAAITLGIAGVLFRGQLAAALVTRGDDALRAGDRIASVRYYRRALAIDGRSTTAADRLAFYLDLRRKPGDAAAAIVVATASLAHDPTSAALLADRGLAEEQLRDWSAAERDFGQAGYLARDARYDHLAGRAALARGRIGEARRYFHSALAHNARFDPARAALASLQ